MDVDNAEVQWRRRWKPTLQASPWKTLIIEESTYLVKSRFLDSSYTVLLTDCTSFWFEQLDQVAIKRRFKKLNPSVEAPVSKLLDLVKENLETTKKGTDYTVAFKPVNEDSSEEKILLTISTKLAGLPFVWNFHGDLATKEQIRDHLTCPLLAMVGELQRRQEELVKQLKKKDKEIDDYKSQGGRVTRKHLETGDFDETKFDNDMCASQDFVKCVQQFGASAFEEPGRKLYSQIMTKHAWLNRDPTEDLEGASLLDDENGTAPTAGQSVSSWSNRLPPSLLSGSASPSKRSPVKRPAAASPSTSPVKSPARGGGARAPSDNHSPAKNVELLRREALERKLQEEEERKAEKKTAKKKKLKI